MGKRRSLMNKIDATLGNIASDGNRYLKGGSEPLNYRGTVIGPIGGSSHTDIDHFLSSYDSKHRFIRGGSEPISGIDRFLGKFTADNLRYVRGGQLTGGPFDVYLTNADQLLKRLHTLRDKLVAKHVSGGSQNRVANLRKYLGGAFSVYVPGIVGWDPNKSTQRDRVAREFESVESLVQWLMDAGRSYDQIVQVMEEILNHPGKYNLDDKDKLIAESYVIALQTGPVVDIISSIIDADISFNQLAYITDILNRSRDGEDKSIAGKFAKVFRALSVAKGVPPTPSKYYAAMQSNGWLDSPAGDGKTRKYRVTDAFRALPANIRYELGDGLACAAILQANARPAQEKNLVAARQAFEHILADRKIYTNNSKSAADRVLNSLDALNKKLAKAGLETLNEDGSLEPPIVVVSDDEDNGTDTSLPTQPDSTTTTSSEAPPAETAAMQYIKEWREKFQSRYGSEPIEKKNATKPQKEWLTTSMPTTKVLRNSPSLFQEVYEHLKAVAADPDNPWQYLDQVMLEGFDATQELRDLLPKPAETEKSPAARATAFLERARSQASTLDLSDRSTRDRFKNLVVHVKGFYDLPMKKVLQRKLIDSIDDQSSSTHMVDKAILEVIEYNLNLSAPARNVEEVVAEVTKLTEVTAELVNIANNSGSPEVQKLVSDALEQTDKIVQGITELPKTEIVADAGEIKDIVNKATEKLEDVADKAVEIEHVNRGEDAFDPVPDDNQPPAEEKPVIPSIDDLFEDEDLPVNEAPPIDDVLNQPNIPDDDLYVPEGTWKRDILNQPDTPNDDGIQEWRGDDEYNGLRDFSDDESDTNRSSSVSVDPPGFNRQDHLNTNIHTNTPSGTPVNMQIRTPISGPAISSADPASVLNPGLPYTIQSRMLAPIYSDLDYSDMTDPDEDYKEAVRPNPPKRIVGSVQAKKLRDEERDLLAKRQRAADKGDIPAENRIIARLALVRRELRRLDRKYAEQAKDKPATHVPYDKAAKKLTSELKAKVSQPPPKDKPVKDTNPAPTTERDKNAKKLDTILEKKVKKIEKKIIKKPAKPKKTKKQMVVDTDDEHEVTSSESEAEAEVIVKAKRTRTKKEPKPKKVPKPKATGSKIVPVTVVSKVGSRTAMSGSKTSATKTKAKRAPNRWNAHMSAVRAKHPELDFADAVTLAKSTYKKR